MFLMQKYIDLVKFIIIILHLLCTEKIKSLINPKYWQGIVIVCISWIVNMVNTPVEIIKTITIFYI